MQSTMYYTPPEDHKYVIELDVVEHQELTNLLFDLEFDDECDPDELTTRGIFNKLTAALTSPRRVTCDGYFHRPINNPMEETPRVLEHVDIKNVSVVLDPPDPRAILFSVTTVGIETSAELDAMNNYVLVADLKCWSLKQSLFGSEYLRRCHLTKGHSCPHSNGESWWD